MFMIISKINLERAKAMNVDLYDNTLIAVKTDNILDPDLSLMIPYVFYSGNEAIKESLFTPDEAIKVFEWFYEMYKDSSIVTNLIMIQEEEYDKYKNMEV